ncbi:MAG TPA: UDP-N-acetylglucosamine 2-epimerase (non-hydrolyzing) [Candidatus Dormibacteraeota bacterium]|nr:UDP-N-acetylglucosamine 2-epimerase (non-hydrolyzing) [Candidatus Dormibacteraeota bacterium]
MSRMRVLMVLGARPQFIKSAPLIRQFLSRCKRISLNIVHSGQHYDREMSQVFFSQLELPPPALNLNVGSGTQVYQTATIMLRLAGFLKDSKPDVVIVPGDTNTTLAAAVAAAKLGYRVAHLEAGLRSGDMSMPEEINRRLTDHCSTLLFAPTRTALKNLTNEKLARNAWLTGDTMVDAMRIATPKAKEIEKSLLQSMQLETTAYVLVTLHRPSNVDEPTRLREIVRSLQKTGQSKLIFPVHPRTRERLLALGVNITRDRSRVCYVPPQGYIETLALLKNAMCLLTDSGGMQKEAYLLRTPCVTLRSTTEWPETLEKQANRLINDPCMIPAAIARAGSLDIRHEHFSNPFGNGAAAQKVTRILEDEVTSGTN